MPGLQAILEIEKTDMAAMWRRLEIQMRAVLRERFGERWRTEQRIIARTEQQRRHGDAMKMWQ